MKKQVIPTLILFSIFLISCNGGGFSQKWKNDFKNECVKNAKVNLSNRDAMEYCNCALGLVIGEFGSVSAANKKLLNMSLNDMMELMEPCRS